MNYSEYDIRKAILKRDDLTPACKLVVMGLLLKVDWNTFAGYATVPELCKLTAVKRRTVQYSLKTLETKGLIIRGWHNGLPTVHICPQVAAAQNLHTGGANNAQKSAKCAPLTVQNMRPYKRETIKETIKGPSQAQSILGAEKNKDYLSISLSSQTTLLKTQHPLTADMINALESQGHIGHAERVQYAREHLNIKLLKGGYYEQI